MMLAMFKWKTNMDMSPLPWRIDQDNEYGIVICADNGDIVHAVYYNGIIPASDETLLDNIIQLARANAYFILKACNRTA